MEKFRAPKIIASLAALFSVMFFSCEDPNDDLVSGRSGGSKAGNQISGSQGPAALGAWVRTFTDDFTTTTSFNNWSRASRLDYNSNYCMYNSAASTIASGIDGRTVLQITATKTSSNPNMWQSGHMKSNYSFKPGINEEYRVSSQIKLIALDGATWKGFSSTYGVWPAFWTVQENQWPIQGEIDIMEAYSFDGTTRFTSNLFYGTTANQNLLGNTCERTFPAVSEGWHMYDQYWKNVNGAVTVTTQIDGITVATYTNAANGNLKLQNFGPHNIIFNMCIGDKLGIFNNANNNVWTKTMMWVDYVTVDKRTL